MFGNKRVIAVLPAYNASKTLEQTCAEIDTSIADEVTESVIVAATDSLSFHAPMIRPGSSRPSDSRVVPWRTIDAEAL